MPSKCTKSKASRTSESSRNKANSIPKANPLAASRPVQSYVVIDVTLPSHIINDRSLFTMYIPGRKVCCTDFGHDIMIRGTGDAHIWVFAAGQYICFCMRICWHIPSSPHHFLSCTTVTSSGYQVMIATRTPRMLFPNNCCLAEPRLPKYVPLTKIDGYWVLNFEFPAPGFISSQLLSTTTQTAAQDAISLHTLTPPFASLAFHQSLLPLPLPSESSTLATIDFKSKPQVEVTTLWLILIPYLTLPVLITSFGIVPCSQTLFPRLPLFVLLLLDLLRLWGVAMWISDILMLIIM